MVWKKRVNEDEVWGGKEKVNCRGLGVSFFVVSSSGSAMWDDASCTPRLEKRRDSKWLFDAVLCDPERRVIQLVLFIPDGDERVHWSLVGSLTATVKVKEAVMSLASSSSVCWFPVVFCSSLWKHSPLRDRLTSSRMRCWKVKCDKVYLHPVSRFSNSVSRRRGEERKERSTVSKRHEREVSWRYTADVMDYAVALSFGGKVRSVGVYLVFVHGCMNVCECVCGCRWVRD